jgi:hypothetical protein
VAAQQPEAGPRLGLEQQRRIDDVLEHLGAGDTALLCDVANEQHRGAGLLGVLRERLSDGAHLRDAAGHAGPVGLAVHHLHGIHDQEIDRRLREQPEQAVDVGLGDGGDAVARELQALGPQRHLRKRLLAGGVEHAMPGTRQTGAHLQEQGALAGAGLPPQQHHGAAHEAATEDPVEFVDAGGTPRGRSCVSMASRVATGAARVSTAAA